MQRPDRQEIRIFRGTQQHSHAPTLADRPGSGRSEHRAIARRVDPDRLQRGTRADVAVRHDAIDPVGLINRPDSTDNTAITMKVVALVNLLTDYLLVRGPAAPR